jgi:hypothetical protein
MIKQNGEKIDDLRHGNDRENLTIFTNPLYVCREYLRPFVVVRISQEPLLHRTEGHRPFNLLKTADDTLSHGYAKRLESALLLDHVQQLQQLISQILHPKVQL